MKRTRASSAEWQHRVEEWRRSGESASVYASRRGWNARTLTWWASHLRRKSESAPSSGGFIQLVERRERPARANEALELVLRDIGTLRISSSTDLGLLRAVVDAFGGRE